MERGSWLTADDRYFVRFPSSAPPDPGFRLIAVARPDASRLNDTCQPNDAITKLVSDFGMSS